MSIPLPPLVWEESVLNWSTQASSAYSHHEVASRKQIATATVGDALSRKMRVLLWHKPILPANLHTWGLINGTPEFQLVFKGNSVWNMPKHEVLGACVNFSHIVNNMLTLWNGRKISCLKHLSTLGQITQICSPQFFKCRIIDLKH